MEMSLPVPLVEPQNESPLSETGGVNTLETAEEKTPLPDSWKLRLGDAPTLELPTDRPRTTAQSFRRETQQFSLSPDLAEGVEKLSCREGVTLFMTLAAAFQVLLHRYSGQDDIAISTPSIAQDNLKSGDDIDFFSNAVMLRSHLSGSPTFLELLAQVREVVLGAYDKRNMLIDKPIDQLNPPPQIAFIFQDSSDDKPELNEVSPEFPQADTGTVKFELALKLSKTRHELAGEIEYNADLFEPATINRLTGHFKNLLEGIVADPELRLFEFPLLDEYERRQLVVEWNNTAAPFPEDKCIHELFEAQVAATPFAVAVVHESSQLTYAELNVQANRLAHQLLDLGVKPDTRVAICLERGLHMVVGLLATLKAGGAYVPMDPAYPKDRLAFMLEDSAPLVLLTQNGFESLFSDKVKALTVIDMEADALTWASRPDTNPDRHELSPKHLAYVIYTSGSTGLPKGVMISHRNLVHSTCARFLNYQEPVTAYLLLSSFSFDSSVAGLFWTLGQGGCLCIPSADTAKDPAALADLIAVRKVSHLLALPSFYALLLKQDETGLQSLKVAIVAGEACSTAIVKQHYALLPYVSLYNEYGPTEVSVWSSVYLTGQNAKRTGLYPYESIGRPIANTQIYILDAYLQPVPIGVSGEIYIGGAGVARGYLNRAELTAERFVDNPFSAEADAKMYKTGDLARWLPDGTIDFLGRNDFQIKIRGFRVEIGEIEAMLSQHPQLREAVVGVYEPFPDDKRLVAYLVSRDALAPTPSELRDFIKPKVPEFQVPSTFIFLDALPFTPNGKLDRNALPVPGTSRQLSDDSFVEPRSPVEKRIAEIWSNALGIDRIGIHDNFFELGGHSILAVKVITEVNELFNIALPMGALYQSPTIEQLGIIISFDNRQSLWYSVVPIQTQGSRPPIFAIHTISLLDLPRYLGNDQPLYFLRYGMAAEMGDSSVQLPLLKDLASHYIKEMQQVQPHGPYYLIGFSFGGVIAYEMATQLLANGHQVNLLGLLDTHLTDEKQLLPLHRIICKVFSQTPSQMLEAIKDKIADLTTSYKYGKDFWPHVYTLAPDLACSHGYQPKIYDGRVTLFQGWREESKFFLYILPEQGWKEFLGDRLEVQQVSGLHFEICREPHVEVLAAKLIACMDKIINDGKALS
jgi:aspartate racemase